MKSFLKACGLIAVSFAYLMFITGPVDEQFFRKAVITILIAVFVAAARRERVTVVS